jgi:hydrogenase maturation protein HypF
LACSSTRQGSDALIERTAELLRAGWIVAIKGIGGYHLACDATNEEAVSRLRVRKRRPHRPFALMVANLAVARALCKVTEEEAALLSGSVRPIVLLERRAHEGAFKLEARHVGEAPPLPCVAPSLAPSVVGSLRELGLMLPATPLHHLLLRAVSCPLVMTSANLSEEPIIASVQEAHDSLGAIADAFLDNDRPIVSRYDDSVTRVVRGTTQMVRRARGYAPAPLRAAVATVVAAPAGDHAPVVTTTAASDNPAPAVLPPLRTGATRSSSAGAILACGPDQKGNFCLARAGEAIVSQHLGDLGNARAFNNYLDTLELYKRLFDLSFEVLACDTHPDYLTSRWAREQAASRELPLIEAQHHHAHIAAVLAECGLSAEKQAIGLALDGSGYGSDGSIWGGELLIASQQTYRRFAHLEAVAMPGATAAILHPRRMAYALLRHHDLLAHPGATPLLEGLGEDTLADLDRIISGGLNAPLTSSAGRLFDAVSALLGICPEASYDAQPAIELEAALWQLPQLSPDSASYHFALRDNILSPAPLLAALLDDLVAAVSLPEISLRFHNAWLDALVALCDAAHHTTGIRQVALSGGVFMNRYLMTHLPGRLESAGFAVLLHRELPANDGCIAYGQAAVAAAQALV